MYDKFQTDRLIDLWLTEDVGACDLTAQVMIEPDERGAFTMNAREPIVIAPARNRNAAQARPLPDWDDAPPPPPRRVRRRGR